MNTAPKLRFPVVKFTVGVDGGSFGTMSRMHKMTPEERHDFVASYGRRPERHATRAREVLNGLGRCWVEWVGPEDMTCEPFMLNLTGLTIEEHQRRTVANYLALCAIDPTVPWLPVIQGWKLADYLRCVEMYCEAGVDLTEIERVGVGSVCRRQSTREGAEIIVALIRLGIRRLVDAYGG